jgi:hypothetical protein
MRWRLGLALFFVATSANAQQLSTADQLAAEGLFQEAKALVSVGKMAEACPKFAESQRLDPQLGTLLYLATCHSQQGKTATAWAEYLDAVDQANRAHDTAREKIARERADKLYPQVPRVTLDIDQTNSQVEIAIDGQASRVGAGVPIPLDPGKHTIAVSAQGRKSWSQSIDVAAASQQTIKVPALELVPVIATPEPPKDKPQSVPESPPPQKSSTLKWVGWGAVGVGVVALGVGTVFGIKSLSDKGKSDDQCNPQGCSQSGLDSYSDARNAAHVADVALIVGVVAVGAGVVILLTQPSAPTTAKRLEPRWTF